MDRRGFFGLITVALSTAAVPSADLIPDRRARLKATAVPVVRANGRAYIVGVACEDVRAGDLVQLQVFGPSRVNST